MRQKFNNPFSEAVSILQFFVVEMLDHLFFVIFFPEISFILINDIYAILLSSNKKGQQLN